MLLYFNQLNGNLSLELYEKNHLDLLDTKLGVVSLGVVFHRGGIPRALVADSLLRVTVKSQGKFDQDPPLAEQLTFTTPDDIERPYVAALNLNTAAMRTELAVNADVSDDKGTAPTMLEIAYRATEDDEWERSKTLVLNVANAVYQGSESAASVPSLRLIIFDPDVTGLTGGAGKLDGIATAGGSAPLNHLRAIKITGKIQFWQLLAGTDAENGTTIVRPDDYNASTNARVWKLVTDVQDSVAWADVTGKPAFGGAALLEVGTSSGTVAAGNDSRITGAAQKASNLSDLASASTALANLSGAARGANTDITSIGGLSVGSVSAPSFFFSGDSDTGLYHIGANDIAFAVNGLKNLEMTSGTLLLQNLYINASGSTLDWGSASSLVIPNTSIYGNFSFELAGYGIYLKSGSNKRLGTATLVAGTITVSNTSVTVNTHIFLVRKTAGGTLGNLTWTVSASTSFTINSDNALDTSTIGYLLIELN